MVSLGPISKKRYCSYSCPFCYVDAGFLSYATMTIAETVEWLQSHKDEFSIIYVSGDTDSFAPPRMDKGVELLEALSEFEVDLLFTTRAVFRDDHLDKLSALSAKLSGVGRLLFGCVSIAQLNHSYLEPPPIAPPQDRIRQLENFKHLGLVSVHAMRPFLPVVPVAEYLELLALVKDKVDIVLGEVWYADSEGILEQAVFKGDAPKLDYTEHTMDFDDNESIWKVYESKAVEVAVSQKCAELNVPFFMRSGPAIQWARMNLRAR